MIHFRKKELLLACLPAVFFFLLGTAAGAVGYRLNLTKSLPLGIWRVTDQIGLGTYVAACVPLDAPMMRVAIERGYLPDGRCEGGVSPILKQVVAKEGDTVTLTPDAVLVNGQAISNSATLAYRTIDPLPAIARGTYVVAQDEYWLIANDNPRSFDSRYFGGIQRAHIKHGMRPVLTF